jgi:hypothetical protein
MAAVSKADRRVQLSPEAEATHLRLRRVRAISKALLTDQGGDPTKAQQILADTAAGLAFWVEEQFRLMMKDEKVEIAPLTTAINSLRRNLETLGIRRVPKDVTTIENYLERLSKSPAEPRINGGAQ